LDSQLLRHWLILLSDIKRWMR